MTRSDRSADRRGAKGEHIGAYFMLICIAIVFLFVTGISAHTSKVQYNINTLNKQIQESERRIQNLEVKIKSASNITTVEDRAKDLGMVYPDFNQIKYVQGDSGIEEFALALIESVY